MIIKSIEWSKKMHVNNLLVVGNFWGVYPEIKVAFLEINLKWVTFFLLAVPCELFVIFFKSFSSFHQTSSNHFSLKSFVACKAMISKNLP